MQHEILTRIKADLNAQSNPDAQERGQSFSKEPLKLYGLTMPAVGKIAKAYFKEIKTQTRQEIFDLCEDLWQSGYLEEAVIACEWSYELRKQYEPEDGKIFARWIETYVDSWITCDTLCNHTVGTFTEMYPSYLDQLKNFARTGNRWMRRAAAVTLIIPARKGLFLKDIFEIADILLMDTDDLVRKGYGWMLKAASEAYQQEVFDYVMTHKDVMPRTALRYAIEKMPKELKTLAMEK